MGGHFNSIQNMFIILLHKLGKSGGIISGDWPNAGVALNLDVWPWKTVGHPFCAPLGLCIIP